MLTIWHNPRCRKSRETLALIETAGIDVTIRKYLDDVPSREEIFDILSQLGFDHPRSLMRRGEKIYKELALKSEESVEKLVQYIVENPILIERPIVSNDEIAVIGRPPEGVKTLF